MHVKGREHGPPPQYPVILYAHHLSEERRIPEDDFTVPFGEADIRRKGKDVTIVALARMVNESLAAPKNLKGRNIGEVIDPRRLFRWTLTPSKTPC